MIAIKSYNLKPILPFLAAVLLSTPLLGLEKGTVFTQLNAIHRPSLDVFFKNITYLGDASYALLILLYFLYNKPFEWPFKFTVGFLIHGFFVHLFKQWLAKGALRPYAFFTEAGTVERYLWVEGVSMKMLNSFPSGHTTTVFFFASFMAVYAQKKELTYGLVVIAAIAALSRVYLGQHWFQDIYVGALFGCCSTFLAQWIVQANPRKWHQKRLQWK